MKKRSKHFQHPVSGPGVIGTVANQPATEHGVTGNVLAPRIGDEDDEEARRVRFLNFWAKHRILQRIFIVAMIVWMSFFVYRTTLLDSVFTPNNEPTFVVEGDGARLASHLQGGRKQVNLSTIMSEVNLTAIMSEAEVTPGITSSTAPSSSPAYKRLFHMNGESGSWKRLPHTHWPMLFSLYNISLYGGYLSFLPTMHLSAVISPETAKHLRHPQEQTKYQEELSIRSVEGLRTALELNENDEEGEKSFYPRRETYSLMPFSRYWGAQGYDKETRNVTFFRAKFILYRSSVPTVHMCIVIEELSFRRE